MTNHFMASLMDGSALQKLQSEALEEVSNESNKLANVTANEKERWEPKEWRPEYQLICMLSSLGFSYEKIVLVMHDKYQYDITKQHIANILNCEQGKSARGRMLETTIQKTNRTVEENLQKMEELAAERLVQLLENDDIMKAHPFAVVDRSIKVLEGRSKLRNSINDAARNQNNQQNNYFYNLPPEISNRIDEGMKKAQRAQEIHGPISNTGTDG